MTRKTRRKFTKEEKRRAVDDYLTERKSAKEIAEELDTDPQMIYRWKTVFEEKAKGVRIDELIDEGNTREMAEKLLEKELEIEMYQKKVAELTIMNDLLKKLRQSLSSAPESELTGLIKTSRKLDRKKGRVK